MAVLEEVAQHKGGGSGPVDEDYSVATPWQLIRWRFVRHRVAVFSLAVLVFFYLCAIFAEFVSPYDPTHHDTDYMYMPPQPIRFVDNGQFQLRPFVYGMTSEMEMATFRTVYAVDPSQKFPIHLFVKGDPYKLWGVFESDIHLFGVEEGVIFLFGTDKMGRDVLRARSLGRASRFRWACWASPSASSSASSWAACRAISVG
ncbi:MAG: hypothetical protein R2873_24530 [Caldilineaceae bacterium]